MLLSFSTKSILFGTFSNIVNEVHQSKHSKSTLKYLDCAHNSIINKEQILGCEFTPEMFNTFLSRLKYDDINLSEKQLKSLFMVCASEKESYMQHSFQLNINLIYAGDYAHKFSKKITCRNRSDKLITDLYTIVSMLGKVSSSRLTFAKSNDELDPIFSKCQI